MEREYNFPVFGTQGGGLVQEVAPNTYVFVEAPDCPGLQVGDFMPSEWGIVAANQQAIDAVEEDCLVSPEDHLFDRAMAEYLHRGSDARQLE